MFYGGSISPPREPHLKKLVVPRRRQSEKKMGDADASSSARKTVVPFGLLMWPMLDRSNYFEWAMLMQCNLEAMEVWDAVKKGGMGVKRMTPAFGVEGDVNDVGAKKTVKEGWDAVNSMRQGADCVKKSHAQKLLQEFENI
jgi:hypothetical protein